MPSLKQMDLDAYTAAHNAEWQRLAELGSKRRFTGAEADELIDRYQAGATQLSAIATTTSQSIQGDRLSIALSRVRLRFTGATANVLQRLPRFFILQLPAALYRVRWLTLAVTVAFFAIATAWALYYIAHPEIIASMYTEEERRRLAEEDFIDYYSNNAEGTFSVMVWANNAFIAAVSLATGILFGLFPIYSIVSNAAGIGSTAALMHEFDHLDVFFLYIAPHGQLELYAVFLACATGIFIFWSWIAPGARKRSVALAEDGRAFFTIVIGCALALGVSGLIEGFVTRQDWPWPIKIGIGTVALVAFLLYQWVVGRRAFRAGETGDLEEFEAGARQLVAG
jgi:uncharacterized membrane protein SpoIIM required for sporulation